MNNKPISLTIPAQPKFARCVRMMAANLAVVCNMSVDDVEDLRMAAEEAFVYSCSTAAYMCTLSFELNNSVASISATLGSKPFHTIDDEDIRLVEMMLSAVSDSFSIEDNVLHIEKTIGRVYDDE